MRILFEGTNDLSREEWLKRRLAGIGGSEASIILGLNKWKTPFQLWLEKTNQVEMQEAGSEAAHFGTILEEVVANEFALRSGKKVRRKNSIFQHDEHDFMIANIDRFVVGEKTILECKTTSAYNAKEWDGDNIPEAYIIQIQHYLAVTGYEKGYFATLIGGNRFVWKEIERDDELISIIINAEKHFWEFNVIGKNPPPLDGTTAAEKFMNERYKDSEKGKVVNLPFAAKEKIQLHAEIKAQIAALDEQKTKIENELKEEVKDAEIGLIGEYAVNWKGVTSNRVDTKALKEKFPDVYKVCVKESVSRRFEIKELV